MVRLLRYLLLTCCASNIAYAEQTAAKTEVASKAAGKETSKEPKKRSENAPSDTSDASAAAALIDGSVAASARVVSVFFTSSYSMLAVSDDDPANDRSMNYWLATSVALPVQGLRIHADGGVSEFFTAEQDDSAWRLTDMALGVSFGHALFPDKRLRLLHRLNAWLPTSRMSQQRDLFLAPTLVTNGSYKLLSRLRLTYRFFTQYRWHEYAETTSGLAMNTQWILGQRVGFIVHALSHPKIGQISIAGGTGFNWNRRYESRDTHSSPSSDPALWVQSLAWNLSLQYVPLNWLVASAGLSHGSPIRRNGIRNPFFVHRDMTELNVSATLMY